MSSLDFSMVGSVTLVAGTATVLMPGVVATDLVMYSRGAAGAGALGNLSCVVNAGVSVVFTSSANTDVSTVNYTVHHVSTVAKPQTPKSVPSRY